MKSINKDIEKEFNLIEVNRLKAKHQYINGENVYVKISQFVWIVFNIRDDGEFENFSQGTEFYVESESSDKLIITRHKCIVEYFNSKGIYGKVLEVARPDDVSGKIIYGANLPLHLVSFAKEAYIINIRNTTGKDFEDLNVDDIESCFHQVRHYEIKSESVSL